MVLILRVAEILFLQEGPFSPPVNKLQAVVKWFVSCRSKVLLDITLAHSNQSTLEVHDHLNLRKRGCMQ